VGLWNSQVHLWVCGVVGVVSRFAGLWNSQIELWSFQVDL